MTWEMVKLRDLGTWYGGGTPSKSNPDFWTNGDVPWLSPKDMGPEILHNTKDHVTAAAIVGSSTKLVPAGAVAVVTRSGILERTIPVALVPFATTMNQDMKAVVPRDGVDPRWVAWGLRAFERDLLRDTRKAGTTVASIEMPRWYAFELPVPPLDEQRRIVAILEDHLSRLDAANTGLELTVRRLASLELSLAARATFGAASNRVKLADISTLITDGDHNPPKRVASGVPHVTAKGITPDGLINLDAGTYVSEDGFLQTAKRYLPTPGDVIVTCVGTIGRVAVVPPGVRFSADRNLAAVRLDHEIARPEYVEIALKSARIQRFMQSASSSTAQPHLYLRDLRRVEISVPSLTDQDQAVLRFKESQGVFQRLRDAAALAQRRSAALRRSLLAAAFSGRLMGSSTEMSEVAGMITP